LPGTSARSALRATPQEIGRETNVAAAAVVADNALWVLGIALDDRAVRFADEYEQAQPSVTGSIR
jgi:hypothetical protein